LTALVSEVVGSQISLDGVQPRDTGTPRWSRTVLWRGAVRIILACSSSSIHAMCPNIERRHDRIIAERLGCIVILFTSSAPGIKPHVEPKAVRTDLICFQTRHVRGKKTYLSIFLSVY